MFAPDPSVWFTSTEIFHSEDSAEGATSFVSQEVISEEIEVEAPVPPTPFPWALLLVNFLCFGLGMALPYISMESLLSFAISFWFWSGSHLWIAAAAWAYFGFSSPFIPGGAPREADKSFLANQLKRNAKGGRPRGPSIRTQGFHKSYPRKLCSQGQFVCNPPTVEQQDLMNEVLKLHSKVDELNRSLNYFNKPVPFVRRPVPLKPGYGFKSKPKPTRTKLQQL